MSRRQQATERATAPTPAGNGKGRTAPVRARRSAARRSGNGRTPSSLEIAQRAVLRPIEEVAESAGLLREEVEPYGRYKAKLNLTALDRLAGTARGKFVCVAGMTPTRAGEGKTTTAVSLTEGLGAIGRRPVLCLREPSLGPVFGIKGGAAGGDRK